MSELSRIFTKENLDYYLRELAKEYKKVAGRNTPAEIVLVGGAAVLVGYGFRDSTTDIDALICAATAMKDAMGRVRDRYNLPEGWINTDFRKTGSYSNELLRCSRHYKSFLQILNVRVVTGEYLLAMKLRAFREYKNDTSDIVGIFMEEHSKRGERFTFERIDRAVKELYGSWDEITPEAKEFLDELFVCNNYDVLYSRTRQNELKAKQMLVEVQENFPEVLKQEGVKEVLRKLRAKTEAAKQRH